MEEIYSFDTGNIIDGTVEFDSIRGEFFLRTEDGGSFYIQDMLSSMLSKKVRMTCISFGSLIQLENTVKGG